MSARRASSIESMGSSRPESPKTIIGVGRVSAQPRVFRDVEIVRGRAAVLLPRAAREETGQEQVHEASPEDETSGECQVSRVHRSSVSGGVPRTPTALCITRAGWRPRYPG